MIIIIIIIIIILNIESTNLIFIKRTFYIHEVQFCNFK